MNRFEKLHLQLALDTGSWESYAAGPWWTNAAVLLRVAEPFPRPVALELECRSTRSHTCQEPGDCRRLTKHWDPDHWVLPNLGGVAARYAALPPGVPAALGARFEFGNFAAVRIAAADGRWFGVQRRYVELVQREAAPDAWEACNAPAFPEQPRGAVRTAPPFVLARRGGEMVAGIMPLQLHGSAVACPLPDCAGVDEAAVVLA